MPVLGKLDGSKLLAIALIVFALVLPFFYDSGSGFIEDCTTALVYVVMALGLNIVVGFAGLLDLGYVAFFAIGAYTMGWLASGFFTSASIHIGVAEQLSSQPGIHINWLIVVFVAAIVTAGGRRVAGLSDAAPARRLHRHRHARLRRDHRPPRGQLGRGRLRHRRLQPHQRARRASRRSTRSTSRSSTASRRSTSDPGTGPRWAWRSSCVFINVRLRDSRIGRAWIAVREDEVAAVSMGIPTVRVKLLAYAMGAAFGGAAGTFLGSFFNTVNADQFEFSFSIFVLAMIILGGLGSIWGVIAGAIALSFINTRLIPDVLNSVPSKIGLDFDLTELGFGIFGFLLVIMMVLRPQGLIPERRRKAELTGEVHADDGLLEVQGP